MSLFNHIRTGALDQIKKIITADPSLVNKSDDRGFTPLVMATYSDQLEVANYLIDQGADINAKDGMGNTALMGVCFKGNNAMIKMLIAQGADVNVQNNKGDTALSFASQYGHATSAKILENVGAH